VAVTVESGGTAELGSAKFAGTSTIKAGGSLEVATSTFATSATLTVETGGELTAVITTLSGTLTVEANATVNSVLFPAATTVSALAADALTIGSLTVAAGPFTVPGGKTLTVTDSLVIGSAPNTVTLTKATLTAAVGTGITADGTAGTLALDNDGDTLALAATGTIEVAGQTASINLPNTVFGAGTYTATGAVTISANASTGDTIVTTTGETSKLALGTNGLVLGNKGATGATYTFNKSTASTSNKVTLSGENAGAITIPADPAEDDVTGAKVTANLNAEIKFGTGGAITIGHKTTNNTGAGCLKLEGGAKIGTFATAESGDTAKVSIPASVNLADADKDTKESVAVGAANSNASGILTVKVGGVEIFGAKGDSDASISNATTLE
jgi:hypothetical protein